MASARAMPCVKGNCDGDITLADKTAYNLARSDPEEYASQYPTCDILNGDVNGDDVLDEDDDDLFMALLSGGNSAMYVVYTWDAENRLIKVEPGGTPQAGQYKAEYKYDWQGRRIEKEVWSYSGGWTQTEHWKFMYADWLLLLELDGLDSDGVKRQYTWGLDLSGQVAPAPRGGRLADAALPAALTAAGGIAGLLAVHDNASSLSYVYFSDVQGNIGQVVDLAAASASVSMMARYEYDAYGNRNVIASMYTQSFGFSTKLYDAESGFAYFGQQYYSSVLGRLISRPTSDGQGDVNAYSYLDNAMTGGVPAISHSATASTGGTGGASVQHVGRGCPPGSGSVSGAWAGGDWGASFPPAVFSELPSDDNPACVHPSQGTDCRNCGTGTGCRRCCYAYETTPAGHAACINMCNQIFGAPT